MRPGIELRGDFDAASLRALAKATTDAGQSRRLLAPSEQNIEETVGVGDRPLADVWMEFRALKSKTWRPRTLHDFDAHFRLYFQDWADKPIGSIRKSDCLRKHAELSQRGKRVADYAMGSLRGVLDHASDMDDDGVLPANPVRALRHAWNGAKVDERSIALEELPSWWRATGELKNPLRRNMHRLALLSGLSAINQRSIRTEWIDLPSRVIRFPASAMKAKRAWDLPLSHRMVADLGNRLPSKDRMVIPYPE